MHLESSFFSLLPLHSASRNNKIFAQHENKMDEKDDTRKEEFAQLKKEDDERDNTTICEDAALEELQVVHSPEANVEPHASVEARVSVEAADAGEEAEVSVEASGASPRLPRETIESVKLTCERALRVIEKAHAEERVALHSTISAQAKEISTLRSMVQGALNGSRESAGAPAI